LPENIYNHHRFLPGIFRCIAIRKSCANSQPSCTYSPALNPGVITLAIKHWPHRIHNLELVSGLPARRKTMLEHPSYPLIINGERCEPSGGEYADVINPANGEVVGRAAMGGAADVDSAVAAARAAFDNRAWREMPPTERSRILYACAQLVMANARELIELEISCSGATINRASNLDIPAIADLWMNLAEAVKTYPFEIGRAHV
jgi:hypothetical protein